MTRLAAGVETRPFRSRTFLQPLLVTIVGVWVVPILILLAMRALAGPLSDASGCTGECGTARFAAGLLAVIAFLLAWCVEAIIVGFIAGRSSPDSGLALRALLVGVMLPPLAGALFVIPGAVAIGDDLLFAIASTFAGAAVIGLVILTPAAIGFGVSRRARATSTR